MVVTAVGGAEQAPVGGDAQLFLEQEFIQNEADPVLCLPLHRVHGISVHGDSAAVLLVQVHQRPDECGLPGAVASDEPEDVSRLQGQGDIFKMQRADAFFKIFDLKQGRHVGIPPFKSNCICLYIQYIYGYGELSRGICNYSQ